MKLIENILSKLEISISNSDYEPVETEKIELKPTPSTLKEAKTLIESVNAFLNTNGGIIITGIKETKNKAYEFSGYHENAEGVLKAIEKQFTDNEGKYLDVHNCINIEIWPFINGRVAVLFVDKLPEDKKYVFYNKKAYQRKITGDEIIPHNKIKAQEEIVEELRNARELYPVQNTNINNLSVDKLNEYIQLLNKETKVETIKPDINSAEPFLRRKKFIVNDEVTTLGMLVCGIHPEDYIGNRCQVDGFVDSPIAIAQDKKIFQDNILPLMEKSVAYIFKNIQFGISSEKGGTATPEYPENLIRESVNNSLAHRDYTINKYVNINIKPNEHIEIRNPGNFKKQLLIESPDDDIPLRRIIPDTKPRNPNLADVLKVFNKWEGKGIGMATLVNEALNNNIDLPYFKFYSDNDIGLLIRKGTLLDERMELLLNSFDGLIEKLLGGEEFTKECKLVFAYLYKSEIENQSYHYTILLGPDNNHQNAINILQKAKLIEKHPKSPSLYPVFILNREFLKENYHSELRAIFGGAYDALSSELKKTLALIYCANNFSTNKTISATKAGRRLYLNSGNDQSDLHAFDNFKRKVYSNFKRLEKGNFIIKTDGSKQYLINNKFVRQPSSLFD